MASMCKLLTHVELSNFKRLSDPLVFELIQVRLLYQTEIFIAFFSKNMLMESTSLVSQMESTISGLVGHMTPHKILEFPREVEQCFAKTMQNRTSNYWNSAYNNLLVITEMSKAGGAEIGWHSNYGCLS